MKSAVTETNRIALVTGASRGLGLETARQLLAQGDTVYIGVRTVSQELTKLVKLHGARARCRIIDVTKSADVERALDEISREHGKLDVLVNNAAIHYDTWQTASRSDMNAVEEAFATNLLGAWRTSLAFAPLLEQARPGVIVNVSSRAGALNRIDASAPAYGVTKAALNALTISLAKDFADRHVLVNAVCPGWVATDMGGHGGRPVSKGAAGIVWAANLAADGPSGGFFRDGEPISWLDG
ncbi:NAD(P)-dependent dehydrogenase (short-subunit alcohol dehydrogenase family) [Paraburkholderia bannensis]|uniref:NAD(P)-dependent dehydrogenase (Short-subunit alcohol dehydrogenase family) n=1 Tax=Paraburkholderia bannensis TaxID=765414 RepID=A0A7W9TYG6_9BURK|nr:MULTISPECIES: SDR family NAD(P)-dependent oxidoreductase [Paraburkholderia]MBB3258655.1 NAD(P)-dependent dehydrogenase (short-subunit alcohol dehydrogenase family) [Paraburkholderia sp. WP4_3_2]MBB6103669.1 NAD(P)-dependent dehydrogenase (short-subunit alcohol dehydrogenase family) [Paraburkholderia bannensis]